jgi:hypothetical protein
MSATLSKDLFSKYHVSELIEWPHPTGILSSSSVVLMVVFAFYVTGSLHPYHQG